MLYSTALAQAQRIEVEPGRLLLSFTPLQKVPRAQVEENRAWLEATATALAGAPVSLVLVEVEAPPPSGAPRPRWTRPGSN